MICASCDRRLEESNDDGPRSDEPGQSAAAAENIVFPTFD
jgi:hypothetical protein